MAKFGHGQDSRLYSTRNCCKHVSRCALVEVKLDNFSLTAATNEQVLVAGQHTYIKMVLLYSTLSFARNEMSTFETYLYLLIHVIYVPGK